MDKDVFEICDLLGVDYVYIMSRLRRRDIVYNRFIIFYILSDRGYTLVSIGKYFGMNHSTVLHGIREVNNALDGFNDELLSYYRVYLHDGMRISSSINENEFNCLKLMELWRKN